MILLIVEYTLYWPLELLGDLDWLFMKFKQSPKCALAMKVEVPAWFWSRTGPRRTSTASSSRSATSSTRRPQRSVSPAPPPSRPTSRRPRPSSRPSTRPSGRSPRHWSWPTLQVGTKILFHWPKVFAKVFFARLEFAGSTIFFGHTFFPSETYETENVQLLTLYNFAK